MRWNHIARLVILLSVAAAVAVGGRPIAYQVQSELERKAQVPQPVIATREETKSILAAVLTTANFVGVPPPPPEPGEVFSLPKRTLLLKDMSAALCEPAPSQEAPCISSLRAESVLALELDDLIPLKMRQELLLANKSSHSVPNPNTPEVRYVPSQVIERIFKSGFWREFYQAYPHTAGFASISIPVMSKDRQQALVYFEQSCDGLCGTGSLHYLVRTTSGWRDLWQRLLWIS